MRDEKFDQRNRAAARGGTEVMSTLPPSGASGGLMNTLFAARKCFKTVLYSS
jgi:hypothetical protein